MNTQECGDDCGIPESEGCQGCKHCIHPNASLIDDKWICGICECELDIETMEAKKPLISQGHFG